MGHREELLAGVVRVNKDERNDLQTPEARLTQAVYGDDNDGADEHSDVGSGSSLPVADPVQGPQGSLEAILRARQSESLTEVERVDRELEALTQKRQVLARELGAIVITLKELADA